MEFRDPLVHPAVMVVMESKENKEVRETLDPRDLLERKEWKESVVGRVLSVPKEIEERKVTVPAKEGRPTLLPIWTGRSARLHVWTIEIRERYM